MVKMGYVGTFVPATREQLAQIMIATLTKHHRDGLITSSDACECFYKALDIIAEMPEKRVNYLLSIHNPSWT